jgi:hypothetical protein
MNTIKLTEEQFVDLLDEDGTEEVDHGHWRHGHSIRFVVPYNGKRYAAWVQVHHEEGMQLYGEVILTEVRQVEKTVRVWEEVGT